MSITYIQAISVGFPAVQCHAVGDGSVYEDIVWDAGQPLPSKETLDSWIASNPQTGSVGVVLTKYQFRKLFTLNERVAVDNAQSNTAIPAQYRAILLTMTKDMELSAEVQLDNPDTQAGVMLLEQIGLIGPGRATQIISNTPPSA
jgi:hypothetical protein